MAERRTPPDSPSIELKARSIGNDTGIDEAVRGVQRRFPQSPSEDQNSCGHGTSTLERRFWLGITQAG
jgi:hypothetical protein